MRRTALCALLLICCQANGAILGGVHFAGGTPFDPETLLSTYADMLGRDFDRGAAARLKTRLEDLYQEHAYALPRIEVRPLSAEEHIARVHIWAPQIVDVRISGRKHLKTRDNLKRVLALKELYPVGHRAFDEALANIAATTGLTLSGALLVDQEHDNAYVARVRVRPRAWDAEFNVDNNGLERFGYEVYEAKAAAYQGRFAVRGTWRSAADSDDYRYVAASGVAEFGRSQIALRTAQSRSAMTTRNYTYQRDSLGARLTHKLIDHRKRLLRALIGVEQYDIERRFDLNGELNEAIRVLEAGFQLAFATPHQVHRFDLRARSGLDSWGAATDLDTTELDFKALHLRYRTTRDIGRANELKAELKGQISSQILPAPERFTYGGEAMGGAFEPGSLSGDSGLSGRLAFHRNLPTRRRIDSEVYVYTDYGKVWRQPERVGVSSASAGIGVEFNVSRATLRLEYSHALSSPDNVPEAEDSRLLFTLQSRL